MRKPYDQIPCPSIGETVECEPEVYEFTAHEMKYRLVLVGKIGHRGYETQPVAKLERFHGNDSLGSPTWINVSDGDDDALLVGLMLSMRPRNPGTGLVL